jgi:putative transcriptional regulator
MAASPQTRWPAVTVAVTLDRMPRRESPPPLQNRIRAERVSRGWTLEELAGRMGVTRQAVQRWETAGRNVSVDKLTRLAEIFEIPVREMLPGDDGLSPDERRLLEWFRMAPAHERRAVLSLAHSLNEGRSAEFTPRPAGRARS